jgi:hypothetical protein
VESWERGGEYWARVWIGMHMRWARVLIGMLSFVFSQRNEGRRMVSFDGSDGLIG